jgi:zinc protease
MAQNLYLGRTFMKSAEVDAAIEKLTVEQVNAALRKYVDPDQWVAAFAGEFGDTR